MYIQEGFENTKTFEMSITSWRLFHGPITFREKNVFCAVCAIDTLMTKVLQGTLRLLAQAFFCCRRPVTSVIPLQSVRLVLSAFGLTVFV